MKRLSHDRYVELAFIRYTQTEKDMCTFFIFGLSAIRPRDAELRIIAGAMVKFVHERPLNPPVVILLTVLRRWSRCCSYSVWLCSLHYEALHVWFCPALCLCVSSVLLVF